MKDGAKRNSRYLVNFTRYQETLRNTADGIYRLTARNRLRSAKACMLQIIQAEHVQLEKILVPALWTVNRTGLLRCTWRRDFKQNRTLETGKFPGGRTWFPVILKRWIFPESNIISAAAIWARDFFSRHVIFLIGKQFFTFKTKIY